MGMKAPFGPCLRPGTVGSRSSMLRRTPAFLWLPVYIASLLVLNGAHGTKDVGQLVAGIGMLLVAFGLALRLALGPWREHPRPRGLLWFIGGVFVFYIVAALVALAVGSWDAAVATLLAAIVPATAVTLWVATARSKTVEDGGRYRDVSAEDHQDPFPGVGVDESRPMGDSPDVHDELSPHDLPKDHPGRQAAEQQAAERDGVTPGHQEGGARGATEGLDPDAAPLVDDTEKDQGARLRGRDRDGDG
ncbi:MAG: hypothetical protein JWN65_1847 [Solirubrobacterales bacterium]|nr:hypothetical protein [Solirubrobacterales bacterium]